MLRTRYYSCRPGGSWREIDATTYGRALEAISEFPVAWEGWKLARVDA